VNPQLTPIIVTVCIFALLAIFFAIVIVAGIVNKRREDERTRALTSVASFLGWQFSEAAGMNWIPNLEKFALFSHGHSKALKNVMYGEIEGLKAAVFDYYYVTGSGKNRRTYNQSVVYFEPRDLNLPLFSLRPEGVMHKLISAFGYQDIDFGQRPTFSSQYLLRGPDEPAVRNVFSDALLGFYEANQGSSTDGGGNQLFVFRQNYRLPPQEIQAYLNWAVQLKRLYPNRW
jgi:carbonic anhydrase